MTLELDPRTKLFMLFVVSLVAMMSPTTPILWGIKIAMTMIPVVLLVTEKHIGSAMGFFALFVLALFLNFRCLSEQSQGVVAALLVGYCSIIVQFSPPIITAWYVVRTTKIGEFVSAMQRMYMPDGITISLAVVMRFFPTIKEEYSSIRDAMKMRGIMFGGGNVSKMVEYRMIPLLFSCVNIGDELSAAAITRGLGGRVRRTSVNTLKMRALDYIFVSIFLAVLVVFIGFRYVK